MTRLVRFGLVLSIAIAVVAVVRGQQPAEKSLAAIKTAPGLTTIKAELGPIVKALGF